MPAVDTVTQSHVELAGQAETAVFPGRYSLAFLRRASCASLLLPATFKLASAAISRPRGTWGSTIVALVLNTFPTLLF